MKEKLKKRYTWLLASLLLVLFCPACQWDEEYSPRKVEERTLTGFDAVELKNNAEVHVRYGETYSILIESSAEILPHIITEVKDGQLIIDTEQHFRYNRHRTKITITLPYLKSAHTSGSGRIVIEDLILEEGLQKQDK